MDHFGYGEQDWMPCEWCAGKCVDVHHIKPKSLGGKDEIDNLVGLCRDCHNEAHNDPGFNKEIKKQLRP